jgi:hypothetical protein
MSSHHKTSDRVNVINQEHDSDDSDTYPSSNAWSNTSNRFVNAVKTLIGRIFMPTILLNICHSKVRFSIDTGAEVDIIDEHTYNKLKLKP